MLTLNPPGELATRPGSKEEVAGEGLCLKTESACPVALALGGMIGLKAWP
ncbi:MULTISPECIES: hypothetical protein [Prochlorococcus]|nr:hypothetical protein [Prochlorococcus marinus]